MNLLEKRFLHGFGALFPAKDWPQAELRQLLDTVQYRMIDPGTVLMRDGDSCTAVPFVISGSIRVYRMAESGREITLYRIQDGQSCILSSGCVGEVTRFPATAVVEAPTAAAFLPPPVVHRLFEKSAPFRTFVLEQYAQRMADVIELVEEVAFRHVDQRLHEWLVEHSRATDSQTVKATHQDLADHIGTSREVISRILKDWEQRGVLVLGRGSVSLNEGFFRLKV
jgi:CRP/FNR family transcriptional regulator